MDINLMVLNLGNSRLAIGVFAAGELQFIKRVGHDQRGDWPAVIAEAWGRIAEQPAETGVDRVLNIAAAYEQMGKACVVVDAGTAITVDCCNDQGDFLGGAIAPGVGLMLDALHAKTARLPRASLEIPEGIFGQSTTAAIQHGVYHGVRGMVKELAENYATELGFWPDIIATGGDAPVLFENWELVHAIAPDLTLYGIALAYVNHHIKHGT